MMIENRYAHIVDGFFPDGITAGFTTPIIEGDPSRDMDIALSFLNKKIDVAYMDQVHGSEIKKIDTPGLYTCDGIFTDKADLTLVVKTADCMPLIFCSRQENVVGVVHMGWRSAKGGILDNIPYELSSFKVFAGVGMRKCCYEVGSEFLAHKNFKPHIRSRGGKYYFDPLGFARTSLVANGLKEENFSDLGLCSYCSEQNFFSHRKTATRNRTLSFILAGSFN